MLPRPRLREHFSYRRIPCDPPPQALADKLAQCQVASAAAKRIDTYETYHQAHVDRRKAQMKAILGAIGLTMSVGPSVPTAYHSCHVGSGSECAARISALVGALMAMGVTAWSFYDLYKNPSRLSEHIARLNDEISRSMQSKNGESAVDNLFDIYRKMSREEQTSFKALLHERAREPKMAQVVRRVMQMRGAQRAASMPPNQPLGGDELLSVV